MADTNFLQREYFHIPMWGWIVGSVGVIFLIMKYRAGSAASSATTPSASSAGVSGNNGNGQPPNIFFLPTGAFNPSPPQVSVTINRNPGSGPSTGVNTPGQIMPVWGTHPPVSGPINAPTTPSPSSPQYQYVTVQKWPGVSQNGLAEWDTTLWGIANHFGKGVDELATLNGISNPNLIYPGQQIKVPV